MGPGRNRAEGKGRHAYSRSDGRPSKKAEQHGQRRAEEYDQGGQKERCDRAHQPPNSARMNGGVWLELQARLISSTANSVPVSTAPSDVEELTTLV